MPIIIDKVSFVVLMFLRLTAKATVPRSSSTLLSITVQSAIKQTLATLCLIFNTSRPPHNVINIRIAEVGRGCGYFSTAKFFFKKNVWKKC